MSRIITGDSLESLRGLPDESVHCAVTSPPYWGLRDYGVDGQLGLEKSPEEYVSRMVDVFREVRRVLRADGTLWLNIGDSYGSVGGNTYAGFNERWSGTGGPGSKQDAALNGVTDRSVETGLKAKNLVGIPWRLAFALQADGWYLRQDIIWHKPNPMPESVRDRCTKSHEYVFLLSKSARYYWDAAAVKENSVQPERAGKVEKAFSTGDPESVLRQDCGRSVLRTEHRNRRSVWTVATQPCKEAHFAVMPQKLVEPCILAGCPEGGTVLDPFFGAGTVGMVAKRLGREYVGIELNPEYVRIAESRIASDAAKHCKASRSTMYGQTSFLDQIGGQTV